MNTEEQRGAERKLLLALLGRQTEALDNRAMVSLLRQVNWPNFLNTTSEDLYPCVAFGLEPYLSFLEASPQWERLFTARCFTRVHNLLLRQKLRKTFKALRKSASRRSHSREWSWHIPLIPTRP